MKRDFRYWLLIGYVIIGIILISLGFAGKVDSFWNGVGTGLFVIGVLRLLRGHRLSQDAAYREEQELTEKDERNHFLRNKAWACTGYILILIMAVSCIILKIMGQDLLSYAASAVVCLILVLFMISYYILQKKY